MLVDGVVARGADAYDQDEAGLGRDFQVVETIDWPAGRVAVISPTAKPGAAPGGCSPPEGGGASRASGQTPGDRPAPALRPPGDGDRPARNRPCPHHRARADARPDPLGTIPVLDVSFSRLGGEELPLDTAQKARDLPESHGRDVAWRPFAGGREIPPQTVAALSRFLFEG